MGGPAARYAKVRAAVFDWAAPQQFNVAMDEACLEFGEIDPGQCHPILQKRELNPFVPVLAEFCLFLIMFQDRQLIGSIARQERDNFKQGWRGMVQEPPQIRF